jgi:type IV pilus assembly protein PilA
MLAASACRTSITEIFQSGGTPPGGGNWGCEGATSKYVGSLVTDDNGKVTATTSGGLPAGTVTLVPLAGGVPAVAANLTTGPVAINGWRCGLSADGTNILAKYLPGSCRGT